MKILLFGKEAESLVKHVENHASLKVVESAPDVVVCFGGDGTLLNAELEWPGVPKVPIRNSRRGIRCLPHPPDTVIQRLADNSLSKMEFVKIACTVTRDGKPVTQEPMAAMNEFSVHMGQINSAVRFKLWINGEAFVDGREIIGDGFVVSTPFGSTAYFNQITRGVFYAGLGIALKNTTELTSHAIIPEHVRVRCEITRGPAVLGYDNAQDYVRLETGDKLDLYKHPISATVYTWEPVPHPFDSF